MKQEYASFMDNGALELVELPANRTVVNGMWIYKIGHKRQNLLEKGIRSRSVIASN
jgi:hypothetical protein